MLINLMSEQFQRWLGVLETLWETVPPDWEVLPLESKDGLAHRCQLDAEECIF
jgi:hypothetical protein